MDQDSSSKFIGSLTKFLQSLCNGYVEFEDGVELIGHIYLSVDTGKKGKKIDYILNEKVCKSDNSVTFISNSFHALPDKAKRDDSEVSDIGDGPPRSTNTGTVPSRSQQSRSAPSPNQRSGVHPGSKRPGSPLKGPQPSQRRAHSPPSQRRLISSAGRPPSGSPASKTVPSSPSSSSQDNIPSPSPGKKGRSEAATSEPPSNQSDNADIEDIPSNVLSINPTPDFASFLGSLTSDNQSTHKSPRDTKPDTDVTFIKEEFVSEPSSCAQAGSSGHSGRSGEENGGGLYPVMLHQNTSVFPSTSAGYPPGFSSNASSTATSQSAFPGSSTSQSDMFNPVPGTSQDGADPSGGAGAASDDDVQIVRDNLLPSMQLMVTSSDDAHLFFYMTDSQLAENQSQQPTTQIIPSRTQYVDQEQSTLGNSHSVNTERENIVSNTDHLPPAGDIATSQAPAEGQQQAQHQQDQRQQQLEPEEIPEQKPLISSTGAVIEFSQPSITFLSQALHNYDSYSNQPPFNLPTFNQNSQPFSEESSQNFEQAPQYEVVDFKYDVAYLLNTYAQDENFTPIAGPTPLSTPTSARQPFRSKGPRVPSLSKTAYRGNTAKQGKRFGYRMVPSQSLKEAGTSGSKHWRGLQESQGRNKGASNSSKFGPTKRLKGFKYQGPRRSLTSSGERKSSSIKGRSGSARRSDDVKHSDSSLADKEQQLHCEKCGKAYINDGWLERHQLTCSGLIINNLKTPGTTYTCAYCERILQNYSWYVRHTNICRKEFEGKKKKNNVQQDLVCKKCNRKFATLQWLVRHSNQCLEALGENTKEDKEKQNSKEHTDKASSSFIKNQEGYKCVKCKKEFGSYAWMMRHSKACLEAKPQEKTEQPKGREDSSVVTGGPAKKYEEHKCEKCKKEFGSFSWLRRHMKICSRLHASSLHKKFSKIQPLKLGRIDTLKLINPPSQKLTKPELRKFSMSESPKVSRPSNTCPGCKKNFKWKSYLERHSKYCRGNRQTHSCEKCHRSFGSLSWLMRHRHFGKCNAISLDQVNGKSRNERDNEPNEEHRATSSEKSEATGCRKCGRVFKYQGYLKRHEEECSMKDKTETATATVSCKHCGKVVSSIQYLKQHLPSCSKIQDEKAEVPVKIPIKSDLSCRKCGKKYIYKPVLLRHEKDCMASGSDGASDFVCGKCGKKYMYMPMLIRHEERCMGPSPIKRSSGDLACQKCGKRYTYHLMLLRHERLCLDIPPSSTNASSRVACLKCGKKYAYYPVLLRHERFCRGQLKNLTKSPASASASQLPGTSESLTPAASSLQVSISKVDMAAANALAMTSSDTDLSALPDSSNSHSDEHIDYSQCKNCGELFVSRELLQDHEKMYCQHISSGAAVEVNDNIVLVNLNVDEIEPVSPVAVETEDVHPDAVETEDVLPDGVETEDVHPDAVETEDVLLDAVETEDVHPDAVEIDNLSPLVNKEDIHIDAVEMIDTGPDDIEKEDVNTEVCDTDDVIADNTA